VTYKNQAWRQPKKNQLALSQGMLKKGDVVGDADDEVRTNVSQNCITATLSTEEFSSGLSFIALSSYQQRGVRGRRQKIDCQRDTHRRSQLGFSSQLDPSWVSAPSWTSILQSGIHQTYITTYFVSGKYE
jgi:hypothetical protein